jgi:Tfp pilus assembly protein PilF
MSLILERASARRRYSSFSHLFLSALLLLAACAVAFGQGGVGSSRGLATTSDGSNTIQGHVYLPSESKERRFKVRLTSNDLYDQATSTDEDGAFIFNRIPAGHYTVMVDGGNEFDSATETVSIDREASTGGRIMNVSINLRPKGTAAAINKIPKAARDLYAKGADAASKGDSKKAVENFNGAVALYPEFALAYNDMGMQYLKMGQLDKAAESFQAALKITPDEATPRLNYGITLLQQKKYAEAETELRAALKKNDNAPTGHLYLGVALMGQQKLDEAEKELLRAISFNTSEVYTAHRYLGGVYWGKRDYQHAADELETYLKLVPKAPDAERTRAAIKDLRSKK